MKEKIMIVDDISLLRKQLKEILTRNDYEVVSEVANGADAVHKYRIFRPALVIMDTEMAGMNGLDAMRAIKEIDYSAKIIMCGLRETEQSIRNLFSAGAASYIAKPYVEEKILPIIKKVIEMEIKSPGDLVMRVSYKEDIACISLLGNIPRKYARSFQNDVYSIIDNSYIRIIINLNAVDNIDETVFRRFINIQDKLRMKQGALKIVLIKKKLLNYLNAPGLSGQFDIYKTEDAAYNSFQTG